jgi:hypothetical protein
MESQASTCGGRPCWWPVKGGAKVVKKEKLFEHRELGTSIQQLSDLQLALAALPFTNETLA